MWGFGVNRVFLVTIDASLGVVDFHQLRAFSASESDRVGESCLDGREGDEERGRDGDVCLDGE